MPDPAPYNAVYSFSGYQALNPNKPLPAAPLDIEFAAVEAALDSLVVSLAEVRRSDGNLQNGVVSWDGLNADVRARISGTDPRITIGDINPSAYASVGEAQAGTANDKLMTPLRVTTQLDALRAFATQIEAQTGSNSVKVSSPLRVAEAIAALRAYASQIEAEAGSENTKVLTSLRSFQQLAALRRSVTVSASLTWGAIATLASAEQTVTLNGAALNDRILLGLPAAGVNAGLVPQCWCSEADRIKIRLTNITAGSITPAGGGAATYAFSAVRF